MEAWGWAVDLSGRRVVVVGSTGALGSGLVNAFAHAGASVLGLDQTMSKAPREGVELREVDVLADAPLGELFDSEPPPWAVVNAVGGFAPRRPLTELDPSELDGQLRLNLVTAASVTKHALRRLSETGEGRLVHTASRVALEPSGAGFAYSVSKLGVVHLVRMAAAEVQGTQITVNCVLPSIIDTPANRVALPSSDHSRWPTAAEVAEVFLFLASPAAQLISGAAIPVYGRA
jgi:NAD(P)-dependent dehydrogenase (short-subunit alcohol dehydrogenase family)